MQVKKYLFLIILVTITTSLYSAIIDNMDSTTGWLVEKDEGSYIAPLNTVKGYLGSAVVIDYDLGSGNWVQIGKIFSDLIFDDFNDDEKPNNLGGNSGSMSANSNVFSYDSFDSNSKSGSYALKLEYGRGTSWSGYWSFMRFSEEGYDVEGYEDLEFWVKGSTDGLRFKVELKDTSDNTPKVLISTYITNITTTYQKATIPLADFSDFNFNNMKQINIIFDQTPSSGTIYMDEIKFTPYGNPISSDLDKYSAFRFRYKGNGNSNTLEFKISDKDGTTYIRKLYNVTNTNGKWETATVPYNEFSLFSPGDDDKLDLRKVKKIWFAISKKDGGKGTLTIDEVEYLEIIDFEKFRKGKLISKIEISNNPFSPNGDGKEDTTSFSYILLQPAEVKLSIYDIAGRVIWEKDEGQKDKDVKYSILWGGVDKNNSSIKNGLYFYQFTADSGDKKDKITHIIAILR